MEGPEVTVVIPTRNRLEMLTQHALQSALSQEDVEAEVVVVDDASTDGTAARIDVLGDPRVRFLRHAERRGQAQALNWGIAEARGQWVAFLDDDDVWSPLKLRSQLDAAAEREASFVYGSMVLFDEGGTVFEAVPNPDPDRVAELLLARNVLGTSSVMARAELVRALGGFDTSLDELTDWDFFIRLAGTARAAACADVVVGYYIHGQNRRVRDDRDVRAEFEYLAEKHRAGDPPREIDRVGFSRWLARGYLRSGSRRAAARIYLGTGIAERDLGSVVRGLAALTGERLFAVHRTALAKRPEPAWLDRYR